MSKVRVFREFGGRSASPSGEADERAYTLAEVLISLAILGIIMIPLLAWMMLTFDQTNDTKSQEESTDLAALSRTFVRDVQGADSATVGVNINDPVCGTGKVDPTNGLADWAVGVELKSTEVVDPNLNTTAAVTTQYVVKRSGLESGTIVGTLWRRRCVDPVGKGLAADIKVKDMKLLSFIRRDPSTTDLVSAYVKFSCLTAEEVSTPGSTSTTTTTIAPESDRCQVVEAKFTPSKRKAVTLRAALRADEQATTEQRTRAVIVCSPSCTGYRERSAGVRQMTVSFDGSRSRLADAYLWNFGDGTTSNVATPGDHVFVCESGQSNWDTTAAECRFTVTLTVVGGTPRRASRATTTVVVKNSVPNVVFTPSEVNTTRMGTILFDASASSDLDGDVTYLWDFGDPASGTENSSTLASPSHTYRRIIPGATATLTVSDGDGPPQVFTIPVKVDNAPPVARFSTTSLNPDNAGDPNGNYVIQFCSAADCETPEARALRTFTFDGKYRAADTDTYSYDPDGTPASTDPSVARTGRGPVTYTWSVLYKAPGDTTAVAEQIDTVTSGSNTSVGIGTSLDPPQKPTTAGTIQIVFPNKAGSYEVVLKVTDVDGATDVMRQAFTTNAPPRAVIDMVTTTRTITRYSTEKFSMTGERSFDPDTVQPIKTYRWVVSAVPSGTVVLDVTNTTPAFTPDLTWGRYRIKLFVRDVDNGVSSEIDGRIFADRPVAVTSVNLKVNRPPQMVAPAGLAGAVERNVAFNFSVVNASGSALATQARAFDQVIDSGDKITGYTWTFRDAATNALISTTSSTTGAATLNVSGLTTVAWSLEATDNDNAKSAIGGTFAVVNAAPRASFAMNPDGRGVVGEPVTFTNTSQDPDGSVVACRWTFTNPAAAAPTVVGGPADSAACSPQQYTWPSAGTFSVTLEVWDGDATGSKSGSVTRTLTINYKPTATFTTNPVSTTFVMVPNNTLVTFNPAGTKDDPLNSPSGLVSLAWDWGDGTPGATTGALTIQQHTFNKSLPSNIGQIGQFRVRLTVTNRVGLTATKEVIVVVNNNPVVQLDVNGVVRAPDFELVANCPVTSPAALYDDVSGCVIPTYVVPAGVVLGASQSFDTDAGPNQNQTLTLPNIPGASVCWTEDNPALGNPTCRSTAWNNPSIAISKFPTVTGTPKTIYVRVTDAGGATATSTFRIRLNRRPQNVEICGVNGPSSTTTCPSAINFQWNVPTNQPDATTGITPISTRASDNDGTITYLWTFTTNLGTVYTSTSATPNVTIPLGVTNGTVDLTVTDNDGYSRAAPQRTFTMGNAVPVAVINVSGTPGGTTYTPSNDVRVPDRLVQTTTGNFSSINLTMTSDGYSYDPDNDVPPSRGIATGYTWKVERFVSGTTWAALTSPTAGATANYTFTPTAAATPTTYRVTLTVKDNVNATGTKQLIVRFNRPPTASWTCPSPRIVVNNTSTALTFTNNSTDADGPIASPGTPTRMVWNWGDGGPNTDTTWSASTTKTYGAFTPSANGGHDVTLTVYDEDGVASSPVTCTNAVRVNRLPVPNPTTTTAVVQPGAPTVSLSSVGSYDPDNDTGADRGITAWSWTFFSGGTSANGSGTAIPGSTTSTRNPTFTLPATAGTYWAELTVTDVSNQTDTKRIALRVNTPPIAKISTKVEALGSAYLDLAFQVGLARPVDASGSTDADSATPAFPSGIKEYKWEFLTENNVNIGTVVSSTPLTTATLKKRVPALASDQNLKGTIVLTVTDVDGATATDTQPLTVFNASPTARITITPTSAAVAAPAQVILSGATSSDDSNDPASYTYAWTIKLQSTGAVVATGTGVTYSPPLPAGVYVASLVVTDGDGENSLTDTVTGLPVPAPTQVFTIQGKPTAVITSNPVNTVFSGTSSARRVTFDGLASTDPDTPLANLTFAWTVVDKNNQELTSWFGSAANPVDFSGFGTFTVTLTVTDPEGNVGTATKTVVINSKPIVVLDVTPKVITEGGTSTFTFDPKAGDPAGTRDPDGTLTAYEWKFYGTDGTTVLATRNPTTLGTEAYTFPSTPGVYSATLMVTDNVGATTTERISVRVNARPTAVLQSGGFAIKRGTTFVLDGSGSTDTDSGTAANPSGIATYVWDFRDSGGTIVRTVTSALPSTTVTFTNTLITGGSVTVTVTDLDGGTRTSASQPFSVSNSAPTPVITMQPSQTAAVTPFAPTLRHSLSTDVDGTITSYRWQIFKDGNPTAVFDQTRTVSTDTVSYTFATVGNYVIRLTVTDDSGDSAFVEQNFKANDRPVAGIKDAASLTATVGTPATFDGSTPTYSTDSDGTVQGWAWVFRRPDGTILATAATATTQVTFPAAGTYTVALTVTDDNGAQSTTTPAYNITVTP